MAYDDWRTAFERHVFPAEGDKARASVWNLENEYRIDAVCDSARTQLGTRFAELLQGGVAEAEAADTAFRDLGDETRELGSSWLGKLALPAGEMDCWTYMDTDQIEKRHMAKVALDPENPPGRVTLRRPLKTSARSSIRPRPVGRFIWVTFPRDSQSVSQSDPTAVKRELGLDHFPMGEYVYRFDIRVESTHRRCIPTCFDAQLYHPWCPPPPGHTEPYGLTRDLSDGTLRWPEVVIEVVDQMSNSTPTGHLVSPPGSPQKIGPLTVDFMVGRQATK